MQTIGNFDELATPYHVGRQGFDQKVFDLLAAKADGLAGKDVLDIGCGTGIATRVLKQHDANVTGSDLAEGMITKAQQQSADISYVVATAAALPFADKAFDLITAFSAFHWFADQGSVNEIQRVLKHGGVFAVINKNDVAGIRKEVTAFFTKYRSDKGAKADYSPAQILKQAGFANVSEHVVVGTELFTPMEARAYLQSIALWNLVPETERENVLMQIERFCDKTLETEGVLKRDLETVIVIGHKT